MTKPASLPMGWFTKQPTNGSATAWYAVGVLLVAYIFSIMDRQILTLLVGPIQRSLGVNDTLMGLLHGFTFAAFYAVMGLPIARLIDRGNRRIVLAVGIAMWSLATAAGGLANEYWHLVAARIGVAVGEAVLIPGAVSLLADLFSPDKRGRAMGVFGAGGPVGAGVGLLAGGVLLGMFTASPAVLPFVGAITPWQATFIAVGLPGVVIALLMLGVPEPRRTGAARDAKALGVPVSSTVAYVTATARPSPRSCSAPASSTSPSMRGRAGRRPTSCASSAGPIRRSARPLGLILAVAGPLGALGGSWLADIWRRKGVAHANLRVGVLSCVGIAAASALMVLAGKPRGRDGLPGAGRGVLLRAVRRRTGDHPGHRARADARSARRAVHRRAEHHRRGPRPRGGGRDHRLRAAAIRRRSALSMSATCVTAGAIGLLLFRSGFASYAATCADAGGWRETPAAPAAGAAKLQAVTQ